MESRGENAEKRSMGGQAITRRSTGCDRGSPCLNCISARLDCTHSAVASKATSPKQRVLISAQYEQKIDGIARDIDGIKLLLQQLNVTPDEANPEDGSTGHLNEAGAIKALIGHRPVSASAGESLWGHSTHIIDFVKAVVEDRGLGDVGPEASDVLSSLRNLIQALEDPAAVRDLSSPEVDVAKYQAKPPMPPLEAVVAVLRWVKDQEGHTIIAWISRILPLQKFAEICRSVYFAVDDFHEVDLILANGYLYYIFSEHVILSGVQDYRKYSRLCQENFHSALTRLPLLLPTSMEVIATLTLATLGYHRHQPRRETDQALRASQENLFWTVYRIEKGLSLRLGRPSNIHDPEVTLSMKLDEPRHTKVARIQGKAYEQLYSPAGLSRPADERGLLAQALAEELREKMKETHDEVLGVMNQPNECEMDPMQVVWMQCDLVCQTSILALILRASPAARDSPSSASDDCVAVAREALDIHEQCMMCVRGCKNDPLMETKYLNWAILYVAFVPFSILFTRAVQLSDVADLARLNRFAASLKPEAASSESTTHPYRLYKLLCQAIELYFGSKGFSSPVNPTLANNLMDPMDEFDFADYGIEIGATTAGGLEAGAPQPSGLGDWFYGNQQIMNLLDEDFMF
ncbi:hypothetical protein BU16DRAFT_466133 [Lophium mytilinum]|uniref:Transcription factor domain-containing protein n=1 Tax=Lophium mytilinum TaxID=390894 RepID=A0A6A6QL59_9PEZI|nr:hypothetical protein BU16DRAFT_466133 [Lophium mytilinum]